MMISIKQAALRGKPRDQRQLLEKYIDMDIKNQEKFLINLRDHISILNKENQDQWREKLIKEILIMIGSLLMNDHVHDYDPISTIIWHCRLLGLQEPIKIDFISKMSEMINDL